MVLFLDNQKLKSSCKTFIMTYVHTTVKLISTKNRFRSINLHRIHSSFFIADLMKVEAADATSYQHGSLHLMMVYEFDFNKKKKLTIYVAY